MNKLWWVVVLPRVHQDPIWSLVWVPATMPGKAAEDGQSAWAAFVPPPAPNLPLCGRPRWSLKFLVLSGSAPTMWPSEEWTRGWKASLFLPNYFILTLKAEIQKEGERNMGRQGEREEKRESIFQLPVCWFTPHLTTSHSWARSQESGASLLVSHTGTGCKHLNHLSLSFQAHELDPAVRSGTGVHMEYQNHRWRLAYSDHGPRPKFSFFL